MPCCGGGDVTNLVGADIWLEMDFRNAMELKPTDLEFA